MAAWCYRRRGRAARSEGGCVAPNAKSVSVTICETTWRASRLAVYVSVPDALRVKDRRPLYVTVRFQLRRNQGHASLEHNRGFRPEVSQLFWGPPEHCLGDSRFHARILAKRLAEDPRPRTAIADERWVRAIRAGELTELRVRELLGVQ
jgi:hypothetical protein